MGGKSIECGVLFENVTREGKTVDISSLGYDLITKSPSFLGFSDKKNFLAKLVKLHNKMEFNYHLADKKNLFKNMKNYYASLGMDVFEYLPFTFHV